MALNTITEDHAEAFLEVTHEAYLGITSRKPQECNGHIYSVLMPKENLSSLELLELSRSWPLVAAIDSDGTGITTGLLDTGFEHFPFTMNNDDVHQQLREMTLPQGSVAFSFSFETALKTKHLTTGEETPSKWLQTIVVLHDGKTLSLVTQPDIGTWRPAAPKGKGIDLLKNVMFRGAR